jgi:iron complex outermembrane receptor protein
MTRLAPRETPTDGHTLANLGATWQLALGRTRTELFAQATNLRNRTARNHNSFLKDIAPLPGRSVTLGLRMNF